MPCLHTVHRNLPLRPAGCQLCTAAAEQALDELRMEWFYREMRRTHGVLMEADGTPSGGAWNFDTANRKRWPKGRDVATPWSVPPDDITRVQIARVNGWRNRWGSADGFSLPVTRADTIKWLERFIVPARRRTSSVVALVLERIHRCVRVGGTAQRDGNGHVGRRRRAGVQAVHRVGCLRQPYERLLHVVSIRRDTAERRRCVSGQCVVLGFSRSA